MLKFQIIDRVAVQNERSDDWSPSLTRLRRMFNNYLATVLDHHRQPGSNVPKATNSCASQGNFLEVLNISLNGIFSFELPQFFIFFVLLFSLVCQPRNSEATSYNLGFT